MIFDLKKINTDSIYQLQTAKIFENQSYTQTFNIIFKEVSDTFKSLCSTRLKDDLKRHRMRIRRLGECWIVNGMCRICMNMKGPLNESSVQEHGTDHRCQEKSMTEVPQGYSRSGHMLTRAHTPSKSKGVRFKIFFDLSFWCQPALRVETLWIREQLRIATHRPICDKWEYYPTNGGIEHYQRSRIRLTRHCLRHLHLSVYDNFAWEMENININKYASTGDTLTHPNDIFGCLVCKTCRGWDTSGIYDRGQHRSAYHRR